ncbi:MAG: hypothetical protein V2I33_24175, partial [Kangiellaceae bacterium]|nr:hypothetical protein [Kangiellaceae bacterium]
MMINFDITYAIETTDLFEQYGQQYNIIVEKVTLPLQGSYENFVQNSGHVIEEFLRTNYRIWFFNDKQGIFEYV